jgi:PAS domain S-box-containing protein
MDFLRQLFGSGDFRPHGYCYLWNSGLVWLHLISDLLIALAYFTIPVTLLWFVRKRRDLPFSWIFVMFGVFIVACGATHLMEIWNLWHANYWLAGVIKAVTAAASVGTALLLVPVVPKALELPSFGQWLHANAALQKEIHERRELELELRISESNYREQAELLELTHDAILVRSLEGKILYWSRGAERMYGWQKEEAQGKISHELLHTQFPVPLAEIEKIVAEKGSWEGELFQTGRDAAVLTVSSRWALRTDPRGNPLSFLEINRDITEGKKEQEKFRNLLESAPDAFVIVNHAGEIQLVNAQTEKFFGYSRDELIGKKIEILIPQRFLAGHASHRQAYSQSPRPRAMGAGLELFGRRKDGTEFPVEISLSPFKTGEGTLVSSAIRDITDRKRAEETLREAESKLSLALDSVQIGAWDWDFTTDKSVRSLRHDEIFGYSSLLPEWGKRIFLTHVLPEDRDLANACFADAVKTGQLMMECRIVWPDQSIHWISVQGRAYHTENCAPDRMRGVIADITDRKRAEEALARNRSELARSNAELAVLNKELEAFSYSVSHDLRAPLRHIDGFARILKEEHGSELSSHALRHLDRVIQAAGHMGHLVDDLLNLARIGRKEFARKNVKLDAIVREAMRDLPDATGREIEWRLEPLPETSCDAGLLKLVYVNLLSNAVKFSRTRPTTVIEVGSRQANGVTRFFVRDNGVGFDQKYADKLFGVFQRLHSQEEFEGTGVGLATVQRIIHRHGGEIWAESQLDRGTTFYFTLGLPLLPLLANNPPEVKDDHVPSN